MSYATGARGSASAGRKATKDGNRQALLLALAVLLIVGAVGIVFTRSLRAKAEEQKAAAAADPKAQIQAIENNTQMPPQAKAMALGQLRAHMQETQARGANQPRR